MDNIIFSFVLTFLAGFSTMIGCLVIFIKKKNHNNIIVGSLSFAAGVMTSTSITDLIPESIHLIKNNTSSLFTIIICFISIIFGIIMSMIINYYVPDNPDISNNKSLFRVGLISMIAIILHNIPEGIATFMAASSNVNLGISLAIAIAMHNIPEGISISIPIYYSTGIKKRAIFYTLVSALSEPFGALIAFIFLRNIINDFVLGILFSIIAGIMLEISFRVLLPSTKKYHNNKLVIIFFIIGFMFMLLKYLMK